jgi:L-lactate dehydrogenase complex protein LldF
VKVSIPKTGQPIDHFADHLSEEVRQSVHQASAAKITKRADTLQKDYQNPDRLRKIAGQIKQHTLEHLDQYLAQAEESLTRNGVQVHYARNTDDARRQIGQLLQDRGARSVVKSKSMATEEIELNDYLTELGIESVETDLGEFIVQIDGDHPSHIVTPIIHKNRRQIARSFERHGLGDYNDDPETITRRARGHLRGKYLQADAGITGANFIVAESGRLILVTNEGNSRFSLAGPSIHIALVGIEKLLPKDRDLNVLLNLLARSSTGQQLTVYTEFINGARAADQPNGPKEMHVVFLDNRRTEILASNCREILRCIRCGACLNVCPVYRQSSGHAYRSVYPGPVGAVITPLLAGTRFKEYADLPKASSLCGACNEVCPVDIPIPDLLLKLRDKGKREHAEVAARDTPPMFGFGLLASQPLAWKTVLTAGRLMNYFPVDMLPVKPAAAWTDSRTLPEWRGGKFRRWLKERKPEKGNGHGSA